MTFGDMLALLNSTKNQQLHLNFSKDVGWSYLDGTKLELNSSEEDVVRRLLHSLDWCLAQQRQHSYHYPLIVEAGESYQIKSREFLFSPLSDNECNLVIEPEKEFSEMVFGSEQDFNLIESIKDAVLITIPQSKENPRPRIIYANKAFERMTGYSSEDVLGKVSADILQGEDSEEDVIAEMAEAIRNWEYSQKRITNYKKNGEKFIVELNISPISDKTGWFSGWLSIQRNMTQKYELENKRKVSELALEAAQIGTWTWNIETNELYWDKRMYQMYDVESCSKGLTYNDWSDSLHPEDKETIEAEIKKSAQEMSDWDSIFRIVKPDGSVAFVSAKAKVNTAECGKAPIMIGVNIDITKEVESQEELEKQKKIAMNAAKLASLGEIAAGVGHEINNPLGIINGINELIEMKMSSGKLTKEYLAESCSKIKDASSRISSILEGLKATSSMSSDSIKLQNVDLVKEIKEALPLLQRLYKKSGVTLDFENVIGNAVVRASRSHLQQVLVNLLNNAKDAVKPQGDGKIAVSVSDNGNFWRLVVADNGPGIPDDLADKIFEPFVSSKKVGEGTGLGLSICNNLANEMKGILTFKTSPENGTQFFLDLPKINKTSENKTNVLVIDDDRILADVFSEMLDTLNCAVVNAYDGKQAIQAINMSRPFDIIFCDIQMPVMNGVEFIKWSLGQEKVASSVIIVVTGEEGHIEPEDRLMIESRCKSVLRKPVKLLQIKDAVDSVRK